MGVWRQLWHLIAAKPRTYYLYRIDPDDILLLVQAGGPVPVFPPNVREQGGESGRVLPERSSPSRRGSPLSLLSAGLLHALQDREEDADCLYLASLRARDPQAALAQWLRLIQARPGSQVAMQQRCPSVWTAQILANALGMERTLAAETRPLLTR